MPTTAVKTLDGKGGKKLSKIERKARRGLAVGAKNQIPGWVITILNDLKPGGARDLDELDVICDIGVYDRLTHNAAAVKILVRIPWSYLTGHNPKKIEDYLRERLHLWCLGQPNLLRMGGLIEGFAAELEIRPDVTRGVVWQICGPNNGKTLAKWNDLKLPPAPDSKPRTKRSRAGG